MQDLSTPHLFPWKAKRWDHCFLSKLGTYKDVRYEGVGLALDIEFEKNNCILPFFTIFFKNKALTNAEVSTISKLTLIEKYKIKQLTNLGNLLNYN